MNIRFISNSFICWVTVISFFMLPANLSCASKMVVKEPALKGVIENRIYNISDKRKLKIAVMGKLPGKSIHNIFVFGCPHGNEWASEMAAREIVYNYEFDSTVIISYNINNTGVRRIQGLDPNRVWKDHLFNNKKKDVYKIIGTMAKVLEREIFPFIVPGKNTVTGIAYHTGKYPFTWKIIYDNKRDEIFLKDILKRTLYKYRSSKKRDDVREEIGLIFEIPNKKSLSKKFFNKYLQGSFSNYFTSRANTIYKKHRKEWIKSGKMSDVLSLTPEGNIKTWDDRRSKKFLLNVFNSVLEKRGIKYRISKSYRSVNRKELKLKKSWE